MKDFSPQRIICLTEETTETLYLLGAQDRIVGISGFTVRPPQARKEKPKVSTFTDANIDDILALDPDLVIGYSDIQAGIAQQLISRGISVWVNTYHDLDGIFRMMVQLGALVDAQERAHELVHQFRDRLGQIGRETSEWTRRPKVYFEEWPDPLICGSLWVSELIAIAGGIDVCARQARSRLAKGRIIGDHKAIADHHPDIILASWCGKMVKKEKIISRDGWDRIPAVTHDAIHEIKSPVILQPGPAAVTEGVEEIFGILRSWKEAVRVG